MTECSNDLPRWWPPVEDGLEPEPQPPEDGLDWYDNDFGEDGDYIDYDPPADEWY